MKNKAVRNLKPLFLLCITLWRILEMLFKRFRILCCYSIRPICCSSIFFIKRCICEVFYEILIAKAAGFEMFPDQILSKIFIG